MALNKIDLAAGIKALEDELYNNSTVTPEQARTNYANGMANLMDAFVKSGTVSVTVTTTGTTTSHTGTGTGAVT